jgi:hypothetical protein
MAQVIDVIGYGPVEFPDGMSKEEMAAALKKLPPPRSAPTQQTNKIDLRGMATQINNQQLLNLRLNK